MFRQASVLVLAIGFVASGPARGADWLQWGFDSRHSGVNDQETVDPSRQRDVAPSPLPRHAPGRGRRRARVPGGRHDAAGREGPALPDDEERLRSSPSTPRPAVSFGRSSRRPDPNYTTSSPAVDPGRQYVYSYGLDGKSRTSTRSGTAPRSRPAAGRSWRRRNRASRRAPRRSAFAVARTARRTSTSRTAATRAMRATTRDTSRRSTSRPERRGSSTPSAATRRSTSSFSPARPTAPPCRPRSGPVRASSTTPTTTGSSWRRETATFAPAAFGWGDTVFALNPDGTGAGGGPPVDSYTPTNYQALQNTDADLGSTAPAVLPRGRGERSAAHWRCSPARTRA